MNTTGPWKVIMPSDEPYGDILVSAKGRNICKLWQDDAPVNDYNIEQKANARLISAAPDMLEALKKAEEWLSGWASAEPYISYITSAISKAQGPS